LAHGGSGEVTEGVRQGDILAGKYRVERVLGAGGMGVVVAAHHVQLDKRVAIKFLLPEAMGNAEAVERFAREARAAVKITSEHVARVIDVGTLETGAPYMVMEFLEGHDLAQWVRLRGPLPLDQTVDFVLQACEAIAEAHALGIVHRDLKPANLFIVRGADAMHAVKVLDFGISKATGPASSGQNVGLTRTAAVMGSPLYMSPEQMTASRNVDTRTDLWAIGVIVYELLAGRVPFDGETLPEVCVKIATQAPPSLRAIRPDIPVAVEAIILKCLEKDRDRRYANVSEFALALVDFGPPQARASAERIQRVLRHASLASSGTLMADGPVAAGTQERTQRPVTVSSSWGRTGRGGHTARWGLGVALAAGLAIAAAIAHTKHSSDSDPARTPPSVVDPLAAVPPRSSAASAPTPALTPAPALTPTPTPAPTLTLAPALTPSPTPAPALTLTPTLTPAPALTPSPSSARPHALPKPATPLARPATTAPSCDPPFTIDGAGIKHPKPECL
jgi:eukaryotic-like serine/threonine-protein kinase